MYQTLLYLGSNLALPLGGGKATSGRLLRNLFQRMSMVLEFWCKKD